PVEPGTYTVRVAASNFNAGGALEGLSSTTGGETRSNTLTTDNDFTFDFGYVGEEPQGSLGDRVWRDDNGNGVQESGEPGLNGVTVRLHDSGGAVIATQVTAGDGNYSFTGLAAGSYTVEVMAATLPAGSVQTYDLDGTGTANTAAATLAAGQNRTDVDFGYRQLGSLGDRVWRDDNGNGAQDSGEPGLNGVTVRLRDGANAVIATQVTAGDGNYSFGALPAGTYKVEVDSTTLPSNSVQTYDLDGIATPNVATASLAGGENRTDVDFGYQQRVSLGDRVWMDDDGDTVQDVGEPGLSGVTVRLFNSSNVQVGTQVTTGSGIYFFSDLVAGTYRVVVDSTTLPAGAVQTYDLDGLATPHAATVTLAPGQSRTDVDFGYRLSNASVGDRVWSDLDGDGVQDAGEPGINGVTVQLLSSAGAVLATQVTAGDGQYTFTNLFSGNYSVRVVSSTLPSGATQTYDLDGLSTAHIASFALATSQNRTDVDFGYRLVQVGGEGCTPGYWKQPQHFDSWVIYSPNDSFNAVFGVNASGNPTLLTALRAGGGGYAALGRHAVAALLNAVSNGVNYQYSTSEVIALVRQAYASGDPEPIKNQLAAQNEIGCPLN
ncbi:MAG TPA: SdrD B-like domain-containing protein, partial [Thermoanaerobaculia bacterium]|nr:SdrD B-like domain-containing protein [Thermoanaerobaculia bacterium]